MTYQPYANAVPTSSFTVTSQDVVDGGPLPTSAYQPSNESPELSWGPLPDGTKSLVVTAFDPDAPIPGGLWHWAVKDIPATATGLPHGSSGQGTTLANDLGEHAYTGVKPPPGTGTHRLLICVMALDVATLELRAGASLASLNIALIPHTLGRAVLTGTSTPG